MSSAKNSAGAPCTHQFLVTLMVQTTKINPTPIIPIRSATSLTTADPILVIAIDAQHHRVPTVSRDAAGNLFSNRTVTCESWFLRRQHRNHW
ncbi:hypothetical protein I1A62_04775 (plasmid) [Rhodococcus sp. USK10]|uniref:hypothetical protein n=1 Tax=Rhodococcus sp. USK10 TaxID=2789739 RepID=UPI001C5DA338|nr:hypothetical protein [Rhodococcus sp. USK10]QYB00339.1 hypothetical protein I1A62_04775 [Rhodococcus sp. USK10]